MRRNCQPLASDIARGVASEKCRDAQGSAPAKIPQRGEQEEECPGLGIGDTASDHASVLSCLVCALDQEPQFFHLSHGILLRNTVNRFSRISK